MKAEERHELKENDLSSWLQYGFPLWLKNNGSYILLVLALAFLGFQLYRMYNLRQVNARAAVWDELQQVDVGNWATAEGQLQGIIEKTDMPKLKAQAMMRLAEFYRALVTPEQRTKANITTQAEAMDKAYATYEKVLKDFGDDKDLGEVFGGQAILGMAAVEEDRDSPAFDKAKALYERLTDAKGKWGGTDFADLAMLRLATLEERKNAPRLLAMVPPWPKVSTSMPDLPGNLGGLNGIPGLGGSGLGGSGLGGSGLGGTGTGLGGLGIPGLGGTPGSTGGTTQPGTTLPSFQFGPTLPGTSTPGTTLPSLGGSATEPGK